VTLKVGAGFGGAVFAFASSPLAARHAPAAAHPARIVKTANLAAETVVFMVAAPRSASHPIMIALTTE
jgi:hypothetical protein